MHIFNRNKIYFIALAVVSLVGCNYTNDCDRLSTPFALATTNDIYYKVEFSPGSASTKLIIDTINNAHKSIYVAVYSFTSTSIADSLIKAHERGVDVKVVLDKGQAAHKSSRHAQLLSGGIPMRISKKYKSMHNKFMVIDNSIVETGSFNYTDNAGKHNAENILIIYQNHELAHKYLSVWQKLWNESS